MKTMNKSKIPVVRIDALLDKYDGVVLFPEKVASANEMLRTIGLPKTNKKRRRA